MKQLLSLLLLVSLFLSACGSTNDSITTASGNLPMASQQQVQKAAAQSSIVRIQTVLGNIDVVLYDDEAPLTVANFLRYASSGAYSSSFIHRSMPGFVIQGGGYICTSTTCGQKIPTGLPVVNEFSTSRSNLRGTIAMAKVSGDPNSATSEWFINLADNSANLDNQNGGFTVFGKVIGDGMAIVDAIAKLQVISAGGVFTNLPLVSVPSTGSITQANLAMVQSISILQAAPVTVKLTGTPASPQPRGTSVTFAAIGSGGTGNYEYQYWLSGNGVDWTPTGDYSGTTSVTADTTGVAPATYYIGVTIKAVGSIPANGAFDSYAILPYTISAAPVVTPAIL